ncbi:MAG: GldG family protein [Deltaproteobacteria bacterium]|nr:GldG family protein [Deltaproteobacteria bacterium]
MKSWSLNSIFLVLLFVCLIAINTIAYHVPLRIDATTDKLYTISEGSKKILTKLEDPIRIKFYFSVHNEQLPPILKIYAQRVVELLGEYQTISSGKMTLEVFDPKPDTEEEEWAIRYGIEAPKLPNGDSIFFGATFLQVDQEITIPFFDPRRQEFLEYDITLAIYRVTEVALPKIAIWSDLPIKGNSQLMMQRQGGEPWALSEEIEKLFDVEYLQTPSGSIPDDIDLLMLLHPKNLSDKQLYQIDQYVLKGGNLFIALDPNARAEAATGGQPAQNFASDLPRLLENWGIRYDSNQVVGDLQLATSVNSRNGILRFPPWISLGASQLDRQHLITSQLEQLLFAEAGNLSPLDNATTTFEALIKTSPNSGTIEAFQLRFGSPEQIALDIQVDGQQRTLLAQIQGIFQSAFSEGPPEGVDHESFIKESAEVRTILLASDVDWMTDGFSIQRLNLLGQSIIQPTNDNLNLALNIIEYLSGNNALREIRSRGQFQRPFTRVLALQQEAQLKYQQEENQLQISLDKVQSELNNLLQGVQKGDKEILLPKEVQDQIASFREQERKTRRELREVRKILKQDIEELGNNLLLANLLIVPGFVGILGFLFYRSRTNGVRT